MTNCRRIGLIALIASIVVLTATGAAFAWFVDGYLSDKFSFAVAFVESRVTLYRAEDGNKDGVIELDADGKPIFTLLGDSGNASAAPDKPHRVRFDIDGILPTQVYTWKVAIQNVGDVRAKIFADIIVPCGGVRGGGIDVLSYSVNGKAPIYAANCYETDAAGEIIQKVRLVDGDAVDYKTERPEDEGRSINEYVIAIRFMTLKELNAAGIAMTADQYAAYMNRAVSGISMSVRLEDNK